MEAPKNYFFIPGFEKRYALRYNPDAKQFDNACFSFVNASTYGRPYHLSAIPNRSDYVFKLARYIGCPSTHWSLKELIEKVTKSDEFKKFTAITIASDSKLYSVTSRYQIVKTDKSGIMTIYSNVITNEGMARSAAMALAEGDPSSEYEVVKTVCSMKAAKVTVTEYN